MGLGTGNKATQLTGYETMVDDQGNVYQSGIPSDPANRHRPIDLVERQPVEVVVESIYYTDEDDRNAVTKNSQRTVMADIRTLGKNSRQLRWVPVLQRTQGLWDEDVVVPRPSKVDIDGNDLSTGSAAKGDKTPTAAESMDGDRALLIFLESNPARPALLPYSQGHPKANNPRKKADGRVKRLRHAGVLVEWSEDGNWTVDATEAAKQGLDSSGDEQANNGTGGILTLKTKDGGGAELHLILDEKGDVALQDGGGTEKLTFTKASKKAELAAATALELSGGATALLKAPATTIEASGTFTAKSPVHLFLGSAASATSFTVDALAIQLASTATLPNLATLVQHTGLNGIAPWWLAAGQEFSGQVNKYAPGPQRPGQVDVGDYYKILVQLLTLANKYALATTAITKAS